MKTSGLIAIAFALAILPLASSASLASTVYDLSADWVDGSNPNGPWTLREGSNALPFFSDLTVGFPYQQPGYAPSVIPGNYLPLWFRATSDLVDYQTGDIVVHTTDSGNGPNSGLANVLFTAPTAGTADISGVLWNADALLHRPQAWELRINGSVLGGDALIDVARSAPITFHFADIVLAAGDLVQLTLMKTGEAGDFVGTGLNINLTPSAVPLPGALPLFVSTLLGAGGIARWRRRNGASKSAELRNPSRR